MSGKQVLVLVRENTNTTTYHFGQREPICERQPSERETVPSVWTLEDAIRSGKRLCELCARLVLDWTSAAFAHASALNVRHPSR